MNSIQKSLCLLGLAGVLGGAPLQAQGGDLVFPQIADGGGVRSEILLTNPADKVDTGTIRFLDAAGNPLQLGIGGTQRTMVSYSIPSGGVLTLQTDGTGGARSGYALISSDLADSIVSGTVVYNLSGFEVSVPTAAMADRYHVFAERTQSTDSGVAVANPGDKPCQITLALRNQDGTEQDTAMIELAAGEQIARFISQIFDKADIGFKGSVHAYGSVPFALVGLRLRANGSLATLSGSPMAVPR